MGFKRWLSKAAKGVAGMWGKAKSVGQKIYGGAKAAHRVGVKASRHYEKARGIGEKVKASYHTAKSVYHHAKEAKDLQGVLDVAADIQVKAKRGAQRARKVKKEVQDIYKDVRELVKAERDAL